MESSITAQYNYDTVPSLGIARMHTHHDYEIYCFIKGDAKYSVEGNYYNLKSGDILIMKRGESHSLIMNSQAPYERFVVNFQPEALLGDESESIMQFIYNRPLGKHNRFPASLFKNKNWLYYLKNIVNLDFYGKRIYLTVLLSELKNAYSEIENSKQKTEDFSNVISFINSRLTEDISLEDICNFAFLSKSQLNRKFKSVTGSTAWEYVTIKRLILAKELLQSGVRPTEAYLKCGFREYTTFYRAYKTNFGIPPAKDCKKQ